VETAAAGKGGSRPLRLAGIAISVVAVGAVVWWASRQGAPSLPSGAAEIWALVGGVCIYGIAMAIRSERWLRLLRHDRAQATRGDAYSLTLVGYMGNNVLPARAGDAMRVYLMAPRARTSMRSVLGTLIAERLLDVAVLTSLFVVVAFGLLRGIDVPSGSAAPYVLAALATLAIAGGLGLWFARRSDRGRRVIEMLRPMANATRELRGRHGIAMVAMTMAIWAAEAMTYVLVARSVGLSIDGLEAAYLVGLVGVSLLIPAGPGHAGTLDAAVLFGARAVGASGSQSVSFLLMLRFVLMAPTTLAGLVILVTRYGLGPVAAERRAEASSP
jgi:uncharacterized membrane protein YbhN (UPF0104 family)